VFATPNRTTRPSFLAQNPAIRAVSNRRKRDQTDETPSVPSIKEAAELASLHRRSKKPRISIHEDKGEDARATGSHFTPVDLEEPVLATPDTDVGSLDTSNLSKVRVGSSLRNSQRAASLQAGRTHPPPRWHLQDSSAGPSDTAAGSFAPHEHSPEPSFPSSILDGPGVAATPPIAESDREPAGPFADNESFSSTRLTPLDIGSAQDASLPSPSLSPITAAANAQQSTGGVSFLDGAYGSYNANDVSGLDLSQTGLGDFPLFPSGSRHLDLPDAHEMASPNPQLLTPTVMGIPSMLNSFDALPEQMKSYVMYQLLRRCPKPTLHFVADVVNPALKRDFIASLPAELGLEIIGYLDVKSMCSAAQVSTCLQKMAIIFRTASSSVLSMKAGAGNTPIRTRVTSATFARRLLLLGQTVKHTPVRLVPADF
jgi:F-box and WD-40 domain protein CDC4